MSFLDLLLPAKAFAQGELDPCKAGAAGIACISSNLELGVTIGNLINFIFVIAVIAALGFLIWGGFKWLTSGGDKAGVEGARNTIIAAVIGLILIFLSYIILNLVLTFLTGETIAGLEIPTITDGGSASGGTDNSRLITNCVNSQGIPVIDSSNNFVRCDR